MDEGYQDGVVTTPFPTGSVIAAADEKKEAVDYGWFLALVRLFENHAKPATVEGAISRLTVLGVDVTTARAVIGQKRQRWLTTNFLQHNGLENDFMERALTLHAYTLQHPNIFAPVNRVFSTDQRLDVAGPEVSAGMDFMTAADAAVEALPDSFLYQGGVPGEAEDLLYRGVKAVYQDFRDKFVVGEEFYWYALKSVTDKRDLMYDGYFCGDSGERTVFIIRNAHGRAKYIKEFSQYNNQERELLIRPLTRFKVLRAIKQNTGPASSGDPFRTADIVELEILADEVVRSTSSPSFAAAEVSAHPADSGAWLKLGRCGGGCVQGRHYDKIGCLTKVLALDPYSDSGWEELATAGGGNVNGAPWSAEQCRNRAAAIQSWKKGRCLNDKSHERVLFLNALKLDDILAPAWSSLGAVGGGEVAGQKYDKKACHLRALQLDPGVARAWSNLGTVGGGEVAGQKYDEKACYLRALQLDPGNARAWMNLGTVGGGEVAGQVYDRKACYQRALQLDPGHARAWGNLGTVGGGEVAGQRYDEKACYQRAVQINPSLQAEVPTCLIP
eukprot:TRINITY_DN6893_c0_g1_i4.p1 TRINITY_DN6893_c0_g1~~TRINITY_DN6893_c0_g1_i4.p1  ORF type:complete len:557 (-),score=122.41 TRINITY_DN6893_c0_g1_i4:66-1736(-)